jgi:hypothetical protein
MRDEVKILPVVKTSVRHLAGPHAMPCAVVILALAMTVPAAAQTVEFVGLKAEVPAGWVEQRPTSSMRVAQYLVPPADKDGDAQFVLFYFGRGQGGSVSDNIARWQSQFSFEDGSPVTPTVETLVVDGMAVTIAEFTGSYARGIGIGHTGNALRDQMLVAAIVETPRGNLYVQLHGPAGTVAAHRERCMAFIKSIRSQD